MDSDEVKDCIHGIYGLRSNVFMRNHTEVYNNDYGVYMDNINADYALTVGDLSCALIYDNNIAGVAGKNIILNIDAEIHACTRGDCNTLTPNTFHNDNTSGVLFDICYKLYAVDNVLLAKGNYWGNGSTPISGTNYDIGYIPNGCTGIVLDASNPQVATAANCTTTYNELPDDPIAANAMMANNTATDCQLMVDNVTRQVNLQYKKGYDEFVVEDYPVSEQKFSPVSAIDTPATQVLSQCSHQINVSRVMIKAWEEVDKNRNVNKGKWDNDTEVLPVKQEIKIEGLKIYPNPAKDVLYFETKKEGRYTIIIMDIMGKVIYQDEFELDMSLDVSTWNTGLYTIKFQEKNTGEVFTEKVMIE